MELTDVQRAVIWNAARGNAMALTGAEVAEIANRESGLKAELARARAQIDRLTSENDVLRALLRAAGGEGGVG